MVRELLNRRAKVCTYINSFGAPLMMAAQNRHKEVVEESLKHGSNINAQGAYENTAFQALRSSVIQK